MKSLWTRSSVGAWGSSGAHRTHRALHHPHLSRSRFIIESSRHLRREISTEAWWSVGSRRSWRSRVSRGSRLSISSPRAWTSLLPLLSPVSAWALFSRRTHRPGRSPRPHNISYVSWFPLLSLRTRQALRCGGVGGGADGTALPERDFRFSAVSQLLTHDLIAQHGAAVTHTDPARLRLPHVLIPVQLTILRAAAGVLVLLLRCSPGQQSSQRGHTQQQLRVPYHHGGLHP